MAKVAKSRSKRPPTTPAAPTTTPSPPSPFTPPSPALSLLLSTLPTPHVYILHLDSTPPTTRRALFLIPLLFNTALLLLLLLRASYALPTYASIFAATLGYPTAHAFDFNTPAAVWEVAEVVLYRMGMFFLDGLVLARWVAEWPWDFFVGARLGSPLAWRVRVGFPAAGEEVVVRRSRRWAEKLELGIVEGREWWAEEKEGTEVVWEKVSGACGREWVRGKSGVMMVDRDWDLYFQGMVDAHFLIGRGELGVREFETGPVVAVWSAERGWMVWRPWEEGEKGGGENDGGTKLRLFKDLLTAMGKEGLFFRWVEMMQYESSLGEGGFTRERREKAVERSRELFEEQDMDWDKIMDGVGGVDGLPGMEVTA